MPTPTVIGLHVRHYKNLRDIWLPWSSRMVLIGPNGAGKTNLLDCCALLMGTSQTKALVEKRIPPGADYDISVIIQDAAISLPEHWLESIGSPGARSLSEVVTTANACLTLEPLSQHSLLATTKDGLVRFRLQSLDGSRIWTTTLVTRDPVAHQIRQPIASNSPLPPPLTPLLPEWGMEEHGTRDPYTDLIVLPHLDVPVDLQWLPETRSESQIQADFNDNILDAAWELGLREGFQTDEGDDPTGTLMDFLSKVHFVGNHNYVLEKLVAEAESTARGELTRTMPHLGDVRLMWRGLALDMISQYDHQEREAVALEVAFEDTSPFRRIGDDVFNPHSGPAALSLMSAGERRWFDEAMHNTAVTLSGNRAMAKVVGDVVWHALNSGVNTFFQRSKRALELNLLDATSLEDLQLLAMLWEISDRSPEDEAMLSELVTKHAEELDRLGHLLHPLPEMPTLDAWLARLDSLEEWINKDSRRRSIMSFAPRSEVEASLRAVWSLLQGLRAPRARVRVFDEPEAHLDSGGVSRLSVALADMAQTSDVLIASHHARFIYQPGWAPYHVQRDPLTGHSSLLEYDPSVATQRQHVAASLGLTAGEALAGARGFLLVEGEHELRILREEPFAHDLESAGVVVLPVRGIAGFGDQDQVSRIALEYVLMFSHGLIGIMFDNDYRDPRSRSSHTYEVGVVKQFVANAKSKGLRIHQLGLTRPDIVAYLNPRAVSPTLDWQAVIKDFHAGPGVKFKQWLLTHENVKLDTTRHIESVLATMRAQGLPFESELVRTIKNFAARAADGTT